MGPALLVLFVISQVLPEALPWPPFEFAFVLLGAALILEVLGPMLFTEVTVEGTAPPEKFAGLGVRFELPSQIGQYEMIVNVARNAVQLLWLGIWIAWIFVVYFASRASWAQVVVGAPPLAVITWAAATSWVPLKLLSRAPRIDQVPFVEVSADGLVLSPDVAVHSRLRKTLESAPAPQFFPWSQFSRIRFEPEISAQGRPSTPTIRFLARDGRFRFSESNLRIPLAAELRSLNPSFAETLASVSGLPVEVSEARLLKSRR